MKVQCTNSTCYLYDRAIETDATECIACGKKLKDQADIFLEKSGLWDKFTKEQ